MRSAELSLLLIPAGLAVAWLFGLRGLSRRGTWAAWGLLAVLAGAIMWLSEVRDFTGTYAPAQLRDGGIVPANQR